MIKISAVICTHNNSELLKKTIGSLLNQSLSKIEYEILIVDNGSKDSTRQVVLGYSDTHPNVKYVYEEKLGLSHARNRALRETKTEYIAFIDDDAEADRDWLSCLVTCFEQAKPRPDIIGGKVLLRYELINIPKYITPMVEVYYSKLDYGDKGLLLNADKGLTHYINGTNMAIRKEAFSENNGFNVGLGRKGKSLLSREESRFLEEAQKRDCVIYYEPKAVVTHFIPKKRLRKRHLIRRFFAEGVSLVLCEQSQRSVTDKLLFIKQRVRPILRNLRYLIFRRGDRFAALLEICKKMGEIYAVVSNKTIRKP